MLPCNLRSLLLAAIVISNCITWTASRHHYTHKISSHRSRHRRQGTGLFLSASYVLPGGEGTGWGEWGEVSPCSRTCGGGVASQKRICLHIGADGEPQCTGGDTKYFSCQTQDCPAGSRDFREQQCSEFDDQAFRGIKHEWVPYTKAPNPCELNCMPRGERFYYRHRTKVIDGTRCDDESFDVCVNGTCQPVGCDMMLGSTAREDKCRECRGSGANCHTTAGLLDSQDYRKGYTDVLLIPESATTIVIAERAPSNNYLALRAKNDTYYLNGDYHIDFPRTLVIAGALWSYERSQQGFAAPDKLRCLGPTNEPLYLALLLQGVNVGIEYEYSVPKALAPPRNKRYNWVHEEFTPCSAPCGGGYQTCKVSCRSREELEVVDDGLCDAEIKPPTNQTCNTQRCPAQWTPTAWGKCSKRCGKGGTRSREVQCTQIISDGYPSIVADKNCFDLLGPKPELYQECNVNATCPLWFTGPWKPCDQLCDEGKKTRQVVCYQKTAGRIEVLGDEECDDEKPAAEQKCILQPCEGVDWVLSEWSGCDTCLSTVRSRNIACSTKDRKVVNDSFCANHKKPETHEPCDRTQLPPCEVQWYATQWSKCSVDCGKGLKTRKVFCGLFDGASVLKVDDSRCAGQTKYNDSKECEIPKEKCPSKWFAAPWSACTEKCDGGEQYRRVMCLRGEEPASDCDADSVPDSTQSCNSGPCNKDGLMPVDKTTPVFDAYEDCVEEEEEYPEVGVDSDLGLKMDDLISMPFSDSPTEGSGMWSLSTAEFESTFSDTDSTLSSEEFLTTESGSGSSDSDDLIDVTTESSMTDDTTSGYESTTELGSGSSTESEATKDTDSTYGIESTITEKTESTVTEVTSSTITEKTESPVSEETGSTITEETESTVTEGTGSKATEETGSTITDETESTVTEQTESTITGSTESTIIEETKSTLTEETESTVTGETKSTLTEETESTVTGETGSTVTDESTVTEQTESTVTDSTESTITDSTESTITDSTESTITDSTESTITDSTESTITDSTESTITDSTESTITESTESTITDSTESTITDSTESTVTEETYSTTTESGTMESESTSETATTSSELTSETDSTLELSTESSSTELSTESESTTESGSTSPSIEESTTESDSTETGSTEVLATTESTEATETTETGSTEATETEETSNTETSETDSTETTETGSTEPTETDSTETTETGSTETTESGSTDTTETGSTESTITTDIYSSTETTETSETESTELSSTTEVESTESTVTSETTETGATETTETDTSITESTIQEETTTEVSGSTETTETGSTLSSEGTESTSESSTTETVTSTEDRTPWDLSSTVEVYTTKKVRVCRPRSCFNSEFGCCSDKKTPALGPFDDGCLKLHTCKEWIYGCCPDGLSPATGPGNKGCPIEPCAETLFGCCLSDNKTAAEGNDQEGCPPPLPPCQTSKFGCCTDGETEATGPSKAGCPETTVPETEGTEISTVSPTTESEEGCAVSEFGCCFDEKTPAPGPNLQGCPCHTSQFGCCPDGIATAKGPVFEGCIYSCNNSAYGCCPDNKTPAHGPDYEGCCLLYAFGCCPDNYLPADGPHLEGCGCQHSRFGCCPDNVTVATGPDNKGCGCKYTEFGCCPDRHSDASGPNFEGCMCHTYQFGCCPDGVTIAQGPNGQGCYCQQSKFGCCGDEQTHAKGLNKEGCNCATSKYGCCLDGTTEAAGPKFQGCTDKPENKQAACGLKFERGPCRNYSVNWYYDTEYGGCSRFWYGGCEGNGNRFSSKEECEDTCVSPPPKDACKLPQVKGACLGYNVRWYYDNERDSCTNFVYGGCLGNNNNFATRELCQNQCEPERVVDQCNIATESGSCAGNYSRWGYNQETRRCEQFIWSGCEGSPNRFHTEAACLLRCNPPREPQPECDEPQEVGNCTEIEAVWSFSQSENRCVPFYYTGCGGNGNKFQTKEDCREACPSAYEPELCTLAAATGDCSDYREKWYYDTKDQRCRQFYYGGCGGNGNNFNTEQECNSRCSTPASTTVAPQVGPAQTPPPDPDRSEFCFLAIDSGPCNQLEQKWAYDYTKGKCVSFQYGGCGGNQNNFPTEEHCTYYCKPTQDICQLPMLSGPCDGSVMSWFYDASTDSCSQFTYGGCEGNENRFDSRDECENRCKTGPIASPTTPATTVTPKIDPRVSEALPEECTISSELEQCSPDAVGEVWHLDPATKLCTAHQNLESGAECRSTGTFYSQEACERSCGAFRNIDVCRYKVDPGPCRQGIAKYYYNATSRRCEEFVYGGCLGGPNRYSSEQECQQVCMATVDPCTLAPEPGNCVDRIVLWYYDQRYDRCNQFAYGGCGGNENKFDTLELCEGRCRQQRPAVVTTITPLPVQTTRQPQQQEECRMPNSLEPCGSNITVFFYDESTSSCRVADIGGCNHPNSYRSEEECERRCGAFRGLDVCQARLDPGPCRASIPKFYFDAASGSCKEYAYGGCQGGPNRFSTSNECEAICSNAGPAPACLQEVAVGSQCGAVPERRWHYDVSRADCIVFAYQGCAGNENNFPSYEECAVICRVSPPEESRICNQYAEECSTLEATCAYGVRTGVAAEGCERCYCEEPAGGAACAPLRTECAALQCKFGLHRAATPDGCDKCKCYEDPCLRNNCTANERCITASDYRDPTTQERLYSAHCVPAEETNEVLPDCEAFTEECARLTCPRGATVQRTRTAAGCERCACAAVDCSGPRAECDALRCRFGLARASGDDGCERCYCLEDPCSRRMCPAGDRCVSTPFLDPVTEETRYSADCRTVNKVGECPAEDGGAFTPSLEARAECRRECNDDADCRGVLKCCARACSQLCLPPAPATTTLAPTSPLLTTTRPVYQAPVASPETQPEVIATEGGEATLRCIFHGNPPPKVTWHFGEITIDDDKGRYRLLSDGALEIVALDRTDSGVYICVAENELGQARQEITLNVNAAPQAPQASPETEPEVTGAEGDKATLRCIFHGNPPPKVTWHFGEIIIDDDKGRYRLLSDGALEIVALDRTDSGVYICVAENELGQARQEITLNVNVTPRPPQASPETEPEVMAAEGGKATLRCIFHGNPPPKVTWRFGEIVIDGDKDRYRLLSNGALEIVSLYRTDAGVYVCIAENELGQARQEITLKVNDPVATPAEIAGEPGAAVTGELDQPISVRCLAYGYPPPAIYWYRGHPGTMVPISSAVYEYGRQELLIRRLTPDTVGEYECEAYNGNGRPVTRRIIVQAYRPMDYYGPRNIYLVPREGTVIAVTPRAQTTTVTTPTTPQQEIFVPPFIVEVRTQLLPAATTLRVGTQLSLPCEVDGYPEPAVHWTKDNVQVAPTDRIWITGTRLTIPQVQMTDSGVYGCHASNEYSSHSSVVQISVEELHIPSKCVDNPTFANCALIVQSRFCLHKYYSRFCCKSCVEAGQLDVSEVEMQADEPFKKK